MPFTDESLGMRHANPRTATAARLPRPSGPIDGWTLEEKFRMALLKTLPKLTGEIREEFEQLLSPWMLAGLLPVLVAWAVSQVCPIGWVVDFIMGLFLAFGLCISIREIWRVSEDFLNFISITASAKSEADLDRAAGHLANFIAVVGVAVFVLLVTRKGKPAAVRAAKAASGILAANAARAGMLAKHAEAFAKVAVNTKKFIMVRFTNPAAMQWITKGYPAKPPCIKSKTSSETGLATISKDPAKALNETRDALANGYYVVGEDLVAQAAGEARLDLRKSAEWPLRPGQIIDPHSRKPITGDYDLMGVVDPMNPGQNITLATSNGMPLADRTNPIVRMVTEQINKLMGDNRVMHGAHDNFSSLESAGSGVIVFKPNGESKILATIDEMRNFYRDDLGGRQAVNGSYPRIPLQEAISAGLAENVVVVDFKSRTRIQP
ncbi:MAG UNVERIFIED_CONTAM: hypothetical protein LVR18_30315 [Planctomycetaceae bacterium]|jgi:hypothetical protein